MRNYVIGTSDHTGRHLNMVQADSVQAALEMCGVPVEAVTPDMVRKFAESIKDENTANVEAK